MAIEFFGNVDKNAKGEIAADMPAWFDNIHLELLEEEVAKKKRMIDKGQILPESVWDVKQEVLNKEQRIKEIKASDQRLVGGQKDKVAKAYHTLQNQIATSMPTKREFQEGFVNPRDELKRAKEHHIEVDVDMANACNVDVVNGKVTGDGATRMYKMMGRKLGENENVERIRREGKSESYRTMEDLTAKILEKVAR